ncbi:MAG: RimK family alpha-L-glutamate ligase [Candidatus Dormibacteria bacterium]
MRVHVIHENPEWIPPFTAAFAAAQVPYRELLVEDGMLDLDGEPEPGVYWSRMSASSPSRGHHLAKDHTRALLAWLESAGRRVVNGRRVLEMEMSKVDQLSALRAAGIDVPRTVAVVGTTGLLAAAKTVGAPFITKPNQGGKGLDVRRFDSPAALAAHVSSTDYVAPVDGITLVQEYVPAAAPFITRVEVVGGEFLYALRADTARGGFELCPADACAITDPLCPADGSASPGLFSLREDIDTTIVDRYLGFARRHGIEIAGFEFLETADGRVVTYDVNTNTNYNAEVDAAAPCSGPDKVALYLKRLLDEEGSA